MADWNTRSTFCVINNPQFDIKLKHNEDGSLMYDDFKRPIELSREPVEEYKDLEPQQLCEVILNKWVSSDSENRTGAVVYCISKDGMHHLHTVFESTKTFRPFSALKKLFPKIHIEITKGSKKDVEDYINKVGKFEEKGEIVVAKSQIGELKAQQGKRTDLLNLDEIKQLIDDGNTPREIFRLFPKALKSRKEVQYLYYDKRVQETPVLRDVNVTWLCGGTGSGKSYVYVEKCKELGEDNVYYITDYNNPFDNYEGEPCIIFDEFRGQLPLYEMLGYLQGYKQQVKARYANKLSLWSDVYITSPVSPYALYHGINDTYNKQDKLQQFYRRIDKIIHCVKVTDQNEKNHYLKYEHTCKLNGTETEYSTLFKNDISESYKLLWKNLIGDIDEFEEITIKGAS